MRPLDAAPFDLRRAWPLSSLLLMLSCAAPHGAARWETTKEDFAARKLDAQTVAAWEDGFRTPRAGAAYEWWYFDGLLEDGTAVVVWFGNHWLPGEEGWRVNLEITPPPASGRPVIKEFYRQKEVDLASSTQADVRLKGNVFQGDLDRYHIVVDPQTTGGSGVDLWLTRRVPSWRPGTGHFGDRQSYFAWVVAVPEGHLEGSVTERGQSRPVTGSGYHDHNWGNVGPDEVMSGWWWGRAAVGEYTVVAADLHAAKGFGGDHEPLLLITSPKGVVSSLVGKAALDVENLPTSANPDPRRSVPFGGGVIFKGTQSAVSAAVRSTGKLLSSMDMLDSVPAWKGTLARVVGLRPWYTRVLATYEVEADGKTTRAEGTLEFMDFSEKHQ